MQAIKVQKIITIYKTHAAHWLLITKFNIPKQQSCSRSYEATAVKSKSIFEDRSVLLKSYLHRIYTTKGLKLIDILVVAYLEIVMVGQHVWKMNSLQVDIRNLNTILKIKH